MPTIDFRTVLFTDFWTHLAALIAIGIGLFGDKYLNLGLGPTTQQIFIIAGFAAIGLKFTNGTAAAINASVAAAVAEAVKATAVQTAAALVITTASAATTGIPIPVPPTPLPKA